MKQKKFSAGAVSRLQFVHALHYVATKIRWAYQSILHFFYIIFKFYVECIFCQRIKVTYQEGWFTVVTFDCFTVQKWSNFVQNIIQKGEPFSLPRSDNVAFWRLYYGNLVYELISSLIGQLNCSRFLLHNNQTQFLQRSKSLQLIL